ncbi:MAG: 50S ribosomal protein L3 [Mycoplasmoidaceae bacterium]
MKMILGRKIGMISSFLVDGKMIPVTVINADENIVIEVKTKEKFQYNATKIGYEFSKEKNLSKAEIGVFKKLNLPVMRHIREFRDVIGYKIGDKITVNTFRIGDYVDIQGISKGKGFTGAIKRWNFKCGPKSHGAGFPHRYQGSISFGRGGSQGQRVMKGKKMSGHHGVATKTISNLEIIGILPEKNLILIRGSIPGPKKSLVTIKETNKIKNNKKSSEVINLFKATEINSQQVQGD